MKKIYIIFLAIFTVGSIASCTKDNSVKPAITKAVVADNGTLGSGDGTPPPADGGGN